MSATLGGAGQATVFVTVQGTLTGINDAALAFEIFDGGAWIAAGEVSLGGLPTVMFRFAGDTSSATQWRVPDATVWEFADAQPLQAPFSGVF